MELMVSLVLTKGFISINIIAIAGQFLHCKKFQIEEESL